MNIADYAAGSFHAAEASDGACRRWRRHFRHCRCAITAADIAERRYFAPLSQRRDGYAAAARLLFRHY
jgi:hypothetical protein